MPVRFNQFTFQSTQTTKKRALANDATLDSFFLLPAEPPKKRRRLNLCQESQCQSVFDTLRSYESTSSDDDDIVNTDDQSSDEGDNIIITTKGSND